MEGGGDCVPPQFAALYHHLIHTQQASDGWDGDGVGAVGRDWVV